MKIFIVPKQFVFILTFIMKLNRSILKKKKFKAHTMVGSIHSQLFPLYFFLSIDFFISHINI